MSEIYFSNNYRDLSEQHGTGAGFQFEFSCSRCYDTWRSPFEPFRTGQAASWINKGVSAAWSLIGGNASNGLTNAADGLAGASWGSGRDAAFQRAVTNAQQHFNRCARCTHYVCERCWSAAQGLCLGCAPDTAAEAVAAQQRGLNDAVVENAYRHGQSQAQQFDVTAARQLVCPQCSADTHGTPFCPSCGFRLAQPPQCTSCHAELPANSAFCPSCGTRR
ncbi:zinc ribbon domain-containing protein [Kitasatospora sp. NPDC059673]|uniref:double zinc ribbon domain-containing protein n=1 Tax=Kitasatospora sp. NPDC059673 TaxID=3346901 RepID=UPI00369551D3